jgi:uncharacterized protein
VTQNSHRKLKFRKLGGTYAIMRLASGASLPDWSMKGEFISITRTADELSIVCPVASARAGLPTSESWICLKLEGPFPFSQTGVLLSFIEPLSTNGIPIFAISTYETDYVFVQEEFVTVSVDTLQRAGHQLVS